MTVDDIGVMNKDDVCELIELGVWSRCWLRIKLKLSGQAIQIECGFIASHSGGLRNLMFLYFVTYLLFISLAYQEVQLSKLQSMPY